MLIGDYGHALTAMAGYALLMVVLTILSVRGRTSDMRCDCGQVKRDYDNRAYRAARSHANAVESAGPFIAAVVAAMLMGCPPLWVNIYASVFLVARVAMAAVHIGTVNQPARSAFWFLSMLCVIALAVMAIWRAF